MSQTLEEIAQTLRDADKKVQLIYAFNGTGKTRLSRAFKQLVDPKVEGDDTPSELADKTMLYYSAFTEDLFYWNNGRGRDAEPKLIIQPNAFTRWVLEDQGRGPRIIDYFQRLTNSNIEPEFSVDFSEVHFTIRGDEHRTRIKISKGEESNLIWCVFYSLLESIIEELDELEEGVEGSFSHLEYIFIDDPVSSLDDNHLIDLAVELARFIKSSQSKLKFIVTTHSPLFYNVMSNELNNKFAKAPDAEVVEWVYKPKSAQKYRLDKGEDGKFTLTSIDNKTPFSYHLLLLSELRSAIDSGDIKKYHFSFLRNIFEKTATFLGYDRWEGLLPKGVDGNPDPFFNRVLNLSSHSAHAGEETGELEGRDKQKLAELVNFLSKKYGFWSREQEDA